MTKNYSLNIFVNCPFDDEYKQIFEGILFAIHDCGFIARCSLELADGAEVRIEKIFRMIEDCRLGIHDLSRIELDSMNNLPRFNMPLELGIFLGARRFGGSRQREKMCLILDTERYRLQKSCSDISGQDAKPHHGKVNEAIKLVRDWVAQVPTDSSCTIPSGRTIFERYNGFLSRLPDICEQKPMAYQRS